MNVQQPNPSGVTNLNCRTVTHTCVATGWLRNPAHQGKVSRTVLIYIACGAWRRTCEIPCTKIMESMYTCTCILFKLPRYLVCLLFIVGLVFVVVVFFFFFFFFFGGGVKKYC